MMLERMTAPAVPPQQHLAPRSRHRRQIGARARSPSPDTDVPNRCRAHQTRDCAGVCERRVGRYLRRGARSRDGFRPFDLGARDNLRSDLFLPQFVALCMKNANRRPRADALDRAPRGDFSAHPPADPAVVNHRRDVVAELVVSPLASQGARTPLYDALPVSDPSRGRHRNREVRREPQATRHSPRGQRDRIDCAAEGFLSARSGLGRLAAFGRRVQEGEPYRSLADLLRYDERLATLNLKVPGRGRQVAFEVSRFSRSRKTTKIRS